jgi:propanediol dehydratase small subunit
MTKKYPLMDNEMKTLKAASGRSVNDIKLETASELTGADFQISPATLRAQAQIAREAGYTQLAANLTRAAELTAVPNDELLQMYDLLRPGRARYDTLIALAERLENIYEAQETGKFVREAAVAYQVRGQLRRET